MKDKLNIAIAQMNSVDSVDQNYQQILGLLDQIENPKEVDLVCFPENSLYMRIKEGEPVSGLTLSDPVFSELSTQAKKRNLNLHLGSVALRKDQALFNASIFVKDTGTVEVSYVKIHLFDFDLEGFTPVRESDIYKRGEAPKILTLQDWKIGQTICYDLRFAELFSWYAKHHCEAILVPSSFLVPTGKVHWEILLRARAIESQCYVIAAAQAGEHQSSKTSASRQTFGNSLVVDPWGRVVAQGKPSGPELLQVQLDMAKVTAVRQQIPMRHHRRPNSLS